MKPITLNRVQPCSILLSKFCRSIVSAAFSKFKEYFWTVSVWHQIKCKLTHNRNCKTICILQINIAGNSTSPFSLSSSSLNTIPLCCRMEIQTRHRFPDVFEDILVYFNVNCRRVWCPTTAVYYNEVGSNLTSTDCKSSKVVCQELEDYKNEYIRVLFLADNVLWHIDNNGHLKYS